MAMLDMFTLSAAQVKTAFDVAARDGRRYLLRLEEVGADPMMVTIWETTAAADSEPAIVENLRRRNQAQPWLEIRLKAVYDTQKAFAAQYQMADAETLAANLSPVTRRTMAAEAEFRRAVTEYQQMPWLQRVFTPVPVAPVLPPLVQKKAPLV